MCFHEIGCSGFRYVHHFLYFVVFALIRVLRLFIKTWIAIYTLHFGPSRNVRKIAGALLEEWGIISQQELANLVQSMRRRYTAVLNAAGVLFTFDFDPPFLQGHIIQFLLVTCLWNSFSLCLSC